MRTRWLGACILLWSCQGSFSSGVNDPLDAAMPVVADAAPGAPDAALPLVADAAPGTPDAAPPPPPPPPDAAPPPPPPPPPTDVTFFVVADTHADPPVDSYDLRAMARAVNAVGRGGSWPGSINGHATGFLGGAIAEPRGVVLVGDITGWGTAPTEIQTFRHYFEAGNSNDAIRYPAYVGLGNHDVDDADRPPALGEAYRQMYWAYVDGRHKGASAPVRTTSFDAGSHSYSWDWDRVHLVQTHRCPGDVGYGLPSDLGFLQSDLAAHAADGRPVFVFHHYGMDAFGTQDRWWTAAQRAAYRAVLRGYHVASIITGHTHFAMQYDWESLHVFQVNNAKAENGTGNNDGNGSFAIVRITDDHLDIVTCRWTDDQGHYELIEPFYSGPASVLAP
jgi:cytolysin (calcineurin-like family phosphatase)